LRDTFVDLLSVVHVNKEHLRAQNTEAEDAEVRSAHRHEFYALVIVGPNSCCTARKADGGITPTIRAQEVLAEVGANRE
jgi:hypothetical protein